MKVRGIVRNGGRELANVPRFLSALLCRFFATNFRFAREKREKEIARSIISHGQIPSKRVYFVDQRFQKRHCQSNYQIATDVMVLIKNMNAHRYHIISHLMSCLGNDSKPVAHPVCGNPLIVLVNHARRTPEGVLRTEKRVVICKDTGVKNLCKYVLNTLLGHYYSKLRGEICITLYWMIWAN